MNKKEKLKDLWQQIEDLARYYQDYWIVRENGQIKGIRNKGGFVLFFPKVTKWSGQEERYKEELKQQEDLAESITDFLNDTIDDPNYKSEAWGTGEDFELLNQLKDE